MSYHKDNNMYISLPTCHQQRENGICIHDALGNRKCTYIRINKNRLEIAVNNIYMANKKTELGGSLQRIG